MVVTDDDNNNNNNNKNDDNSNNFKCFRYIEEITQPVLGDGRYCCQDSAAATATASVVSTEISTS
jgi:hypothetical protein